MELIAIITALALVQYMILGYRVGAARGKYDVPAPATTGNEIFERHNRVHQNTLEQLIVFIPALWTFAQFTSATGAAVLGLIFIAGRALYALAYVSDPTKRSAGFITGFLSSAILVLGSLYGATAALF